MTLDTSPTTPLTALFPTTAASTTVLAVATLMFLPTDSMVSSSLTDARVLQAVLPSLPLSLLLSSTVSSMSVSRLARRVPSASLTLLSTRTPACLTTLPLVISIWVVRMATTNLAPVATTASPLWRVGIPSLALVPPTTLRCFLFSALFKLVKHIKALMQ